MADLKSYIITTSKILQINKHWFDIYAVKILLKSEAKWRTLICTNYVKLKSNIILITKLQITQHTCMLDKWFYIYLKEEE